MSRPELAVNAVFFTLLAVVLWQFARMEIQRRRFNRRHDQRKRLAEVINDPRASYLAKAEAGIELYGISEALADRLRAEARARDLGGGG